MLDFIQSNPKITVILIALLIITLFIIRKIFMYKNKGVRGERRVGKVLKSYARKHNGYVLNGIYLPLYKSLTEVDHIYIGEMGVVVIETKNISGAVYGDITDKYLTQKIGNRTHSLYNPNFQNKTHVDNVAHHLKKMAINVPIHSLVVFADPSISLNVTNSKKFTKLKNLSSRLDNIQVNKNITNPKKVYQAIKSIQSKNIVKKLIHKL